MDSKILLPGKRKRSRVRNSEFGPKKRAKTATISAAVINTRSVTRKFFNVGAVLETPTRFDESQWKPWPAHGMNERPVWHPKAGLASEYLGKSYVTLDETYHEILSDSNSKEKMLVAHSNPRKIKSNSRKNAKIDAHVNLHCVLAYCTHVLDLEAKNEQKNKEAPENINNNSVNPVRYCLVEQKNKMGQDVKIRNPPLTNISNFKEEPSQVSNYKNPNPRQISKNRMNVEWNASSFNSKNTAIIMIKEPAMRSEKRPSPGEKKVSFNNYKNEVLDLSKSANKNEQTSVEKVSTENIENTEELLELLERIAVTYCVLNGVHQDDLADYIDTLDGKHNTEWMEQSYLNLSNLI